MPFIYGLVDPLDPGNVRYVGMAPSKESRPFRHAQVALSTTVSSYLYNWIRKLDREGRNYHVVLLEELPVGTSRRFLGFVEKCYIKSLREIGHQLTNVSEGGWGGATTVGKVCSQATKDKLRAIFSGRPLSERHKAALRHPWTPVRRAAHKSRKGLPWSAARRAARSEPWNKGKDLGVMTEEQKAKLRDGQLKSYAANPERARNHSLAMKRYYENPANREKTSLAGRKNRGT